jgi:Integrase core domain
VTTSSNACSERLRSALTIIRLDIIILTKEASFALQAGTVLILCLPEALRVPATPQREITIVPPLRQRTDRSATGSSNSLELKSDGHLQCGSTHDPHPNCAGTERVQTLAGTAGDTDELSENVASHCASQVQLTAHANAYAERFVRTIKEDCLDRMVFFGEDMLRRTIREFVTHYHEERNHQGLDNQLLIKKATIVDWPGPCGSASALAGCSVTTSVRRRDS